jgi:hypothetical protein
LFAAQRNDLTELLKIAMESGFAGSSIVRIIELF